MSLYDEARDLVIDGLSQIVDEFTSESREDGTEEAMRGIHIQSIIYRLMDEV